MDSNEIDIGRWERNENTVAINQNINMISSMPMKLRVTKITFSSATGNFFGKDQASLFEIENQKEISSTQSKKQRQF